MRTIKFRAWNKPTNKMIYWGFFTDIFDKGASDRRNFEPEHNVWMQFTGLLDKNGIEIYEGDRLKVDWDDGRYPEHIIEKAVYWDEDDACWQLGEGGSPKRDAANHMEVIGNIYEN